MRHALYFRGQSISELRLRDAITRSRRARDFLTQVTCHREVQVALRRLVPGYQTGRSNEYKFNCTVIQNSWRFEGVSILKLFHTNSTFLLLLSWFQFEVIESFGWVPQRKTNTSNILQVFQKVVTFLEKMVLSNYEMRHAFYLRGHSFSELRLRDAINQSQRARDDLTQVSCHCEVQGILRRLVPGYQTNRSNEYKFNYTVIHNS
jgi:hypothetical protein